MLGRMRRWRREREEARRRAATEIATEYARVRQGFLHDANDPPELITFLARLRALAVRMARRPSRVHYEVIALLEGAAAAGRREAQVLGGAGPCTLAHAMEALDRGAARLGQLEQARSRVTYLQGVGIGFVIFVLAPAAAIAVTSVPAGGPTAEPWLVRAASFLPVRVVCFAGFGAVASVLTRLQSIDLSEEPKNRMLRISGAARPIVAVLFAAVVYQIIIRKVVALGGVTTPPLLTAYCIVAAFLCGFSERFATDMLDRVPFARAATR